MLRDKSLIPLSHQHQHALALCVRIERASPIASHDLPLWQLEIAQLFQSEIALHFAAEEQVLFPVAKELPELNSLVDDLLREHGSLRNQFSRIGSGTASANDLTVLAQRLSAHIRKEERQLFEGLQQQMEPQELSLLGKQLEDALKHSSSTCVVPTQTTRLRPRK